jgi:hypothetical protein
MPVVRKCKNAIFYDNTCNNHNLFIMLKNDIIVKKHKKPGGRASSTDRVRGGRVREWKTY